MEELNNLSNNANDLNYLPQQWEAYVDVYKKELRVSIAETTNYKYSI